MDFETLKTIGIIVAAGVAIGYQYYKGKLNAASLLGIITNKEAVIVAKDIAIKEVLAFMDPNKPASDTSVETLKNIIPACTWCMEDRLRQLVLDSTATYQERVDIDKQIDSYEMVDQYGYNVKKYTLKTNGYNGGVWEVNYGIPTLITPNNVSYKYLTEEQKVSLTEYSDNMVHTLVEISNKERELCQTYTLTDTSGYIVTVNAGTINVKET